MLDCLSLVVSGALAEAMLLCVSVSLIVTSAGLLRAYVPDREDGQKG